MQIGEGVAAPGSPTGTEQSSSEVKKARHSCNWRHCPKGKEPHEHPHERAITYPGGSDLARRPGGLDLSDVDEREKAKLTKANREMYRSVIHHLVPIVAFEGSFPDLTKNAELAGYKINEKINLMALLRDKEDVEILDIQYHAGNHGLTKKGIERSKEKGIPRENGSEDPAYEANDTSYTDYVTRRLTYTEKHSLAQCKVDDKGTGESQSKWLTNRLDTDSDWIRRRIESWSISIVTNGRSYRKTP
jgi:hypothetical protein